MAQDLINMMKMMANMPDDLRAEMMATMMDKTKLAGIVRQSGVNVDTFGQRISKEETLAHHAEVEKTLQFQRNNKLYIVQSSLPTSMRKPDSVVGVDMRRVQRMRPINVLAMTPNVTHTGRILRGELVVNPLTMTSVQSVLEDETGEVTNISFYNCGGANMFPKGTKVVVVEPFFKQMRDGTFGVRVDSCNDVILTDRVGPIAGDTMAAWKDEGNMHFKAEQYDAADRCYIKALSKSSAGLLVNVLSNASLVLLKLEKPTHAFAAAATAVVLAPGEPKPKHRFAKATLALGETDLATALSSPGNKKRQSGKTNHSKPMSEDEVSNRLAELLIAAPNLGHSTSVARDAYEEAEKAKAEGNGFFYNGDFIEALRCYKNAIGMLVLPASVLMSNRAACALKSQQYQQAVALASAVVVLVPGFPKGQFRRAQALIALGRSELARISIANAPVSCASALKELSDQLDSPIQQKKAKTPKEAGTSHLTEAGFKEATEQTSTVVSAAQLSKLGNLLQMAMGSQATGKDGLIDARVTAFHEEFATQGLFPQGVDVAKCQQKLWEWYENARIQMRKEMLATLEAEAFKVTFKMPSMFQRSQARDCVAEWCLQSPPPAIGSVFAMPENISVAYGTGIHQSFPNSPRKSPTLSPGSTHVAIGFVDLGELLFSDVLDRSISTATDVTPTTSYFPTAGTPKAINWIGFEMSPYAVAKTSVVLQMLRDNANTNAVVQVWFSSTWTKATLAAFKQAIPRVLANLSDVTQDRQLCPVVDLLALWRNAHTVSLSAARRLWLETQSVTHVEVASLRNSKDQMALCSYALTGDVLTKETSESVLVGSTAMFVFPGELGALAIDESIFHFIPIEMLLEERKQGHDLVEAAVRLLTRRASLLGEAIRASEVHVDVRLGHVAPTNRVVLEEIRRLMPQSISWTNVPDYFAPHELHLMAEYMGREAKHYIFPMNWATIVYGTFLIDYDDVKERSRIMKSAGEDMIRVSREQGLDTVFHVPPMDNPMNLSGTYLCSQLYGKWIDDFMSHASCGVKVYSSGLFPNTGLLRFAGILHVCFSYASNGDDGPDTPFEIDG